MDICSNEWNIVWKELVKFIMGILFCINKSKFGGLITGSSDGEICVLDH